MENKEQKLLDHIEAIVELSSNSKLSVDFFSKAKPHLEMLSKLLKINDMQAVIVSILIDNIDRSTVDISRIARHLDCKNITLLKYYADFEKLEKQGYIYCKDEKEEKSYRVVYEAFEAIKENKEYVPKKMENLTIDEFFSEIELVFDKRKDELITYDRAFESIHSLLDNNKHLSITQKIQKYKLDKSDQLLLLYFCYLFVVDNDDRVMKSDLNELYDRSSQCKAVVRELRGGTHELFKNKLVEYGTEDGFQNKDEYKLTDEAKNELLAELNIELKQCKKKKGFILASGIKEKQLFYNSREEKEVARLGNLLQDSSFKSITERLEKNGMRKGVACLFYGGPGTGKTETVYQIAHSTGRDIMMVDISETKSCWLGESEKKIKGVFDTYREYVKTEKTAPILLFNEADAVIGTRNEVSGVNSTISETNNRIQNIILQEMENLEGIMIATTNLTKNLDKAFERRFLYKIEFDKPNLAAKENIWQTMLPALTQTERTELASKYDFSGGQIENIVRKYTVDSILNETQPSMEMLHSYCQSEFLYKDNRQKIGFKVN
jgi:hypothetical protein